MGPFSSRCTQSHTFPRPIPNDMPRPLLTALALLFSICSAAVGQETADTEWSGLLARDERISFTGRTELAALTALNGGGLDDEGRAAAFFALGASGSSHGRELLEKTLASGALRERCAAVLALGEMGVGVSDLLEGSREDPDPLVSECALLALMRTGRWAAAEYVEAVAASGDEAHAQMAGQLLLFATNAPASEATAASQLLLELRWDAARRFGLVDRQAWDVVLIEELANDPDFLKGMLLRAASELDRPGVKDHFLSIVESERKRSGVVSETTLRAALRAMPTEVSLLVETGMWTPRLDILLSEIRESALEDSTKSILTMAYKNPAMRYQAISLLVRSGEQAPLLSMMEEINSGELGPMQLIWCCDALGSSRAQAARSQLELLSGHARTEVSWAAQIQLARLGSEEAAEAVRGVLSNPSSPVHRQVVSLVSHSVEDSTLAGLLTDALDTLKGARALEVSIALSGRGNAVAREHLRDILSTGLPGGRLGARAVEELSRSASVEDAAYLQLQFPYEGDIVVNEALALAMFRIGDPRVLPLIRAGIWDSEEFDLSVLASALLVEVAGMRALLDEVRHERPRLDTYTGRLVFREPSAPRRVGYALGLWGGVSALNELSSDPYVRAPALQGALLGALASRTH